ncbi:MAG: hypothetical protein U0610_03380 [bacterium]
MLSGEALPHALRALFGVMASNGVVTEAERRFLEVIGELHGSRVDVSTLAPIAGAEVARVIEDPHQRKRVVQLALIAAMVEGEVRPEGRAAVDALADALGVDERGLKVIADLAAGHRLATRFDMVRRMMGNIGPKVLEEEGFAGVRKMLAPLTGAENPEVAWRYKSLGLLPEGTFGRVFWEHCTRRRFAFPGEKGGLPERMVFHDFGHVLSGYDTDAPGEIQQGAFQAGFTRQDGFTFLLFAVIQFHIGIRLTPVAQAETGLFDVAKVLRAAQRGAACKVDLGDHWDPFSVTSLPLAQVREDYGIPPA